MSWEATKAIGRGVAYVFKALLVAYWFLISLLFGLALLGGFVAMAGAFAGWTEVKLLGSASLAIGVVGSLFLMVLGEGLVPFPAQLNKSGRPKAGGPDQKDRQ
jgi:hypothetical protein